MTQDRKDQLYDEMIAWICEQSSSDEDLFQILHVQLGMAMEELHDHCIESLDPFFPTVEVYEVEESDQAAQSTPREFQML